MDDNLSLQRSNELWKRAVELVRSTQNEEEADPDLEVTPKLQVLNEALAAARQKEAEGRLRQIKVRGRGEEEIIVWEIYGKIAGGIQKFRDLGDVLVNIDPIHAAAPWALCRGILLVATAKYEAHCLMLSQLEKVTDLMYYFRTFEKIYLSESDVSAARSTVEACLTKLYSTILRFLLKAKKYFTKQKGYRKVKSNFQAVFGLDSETQGLVSSIASQQEEVHRTAPLLHHERENSLLSWAHGLSEDLTSLQKRVDQVRMQEERSRNSLILDWLSMTRVTRQHEIAREGRLDKSGSWLLEGDTFREWRAASGSSIIWLHGSAGFGKTKLVSAVVDSMQQASGSRITYFYCSRGSGDELSRIDHKGVFRSVARQLATAGPGPIVEMHARALYEQREEEGLGEPREPRFDEMADLIIKISKETPVTILLDALDECKKESWTVVVKKLFELVDRGQVKIFLSSRNYGKLSEGLHRAIDVNLGEQENAEDIARFIQHEITTREFEFQLTKDLQDEVIMKLQNTARGMFLWAKLQIDDLCNAPTATALRGRLGRLPRDLDSWYAENLARIRLDARDGYDTEYGIATATLCWLRCADVSMSGNALLAAVGLSAEDPKRAKDVVLDVCHNLVIYDSISYGFRFQHLSVREYLERSNALQDNEDQLQNFAAERCLECLLTVPSMPNEINPGEREFRQYAMLHFVRHLSMVKVRNSQLQSKIDDFLDTGLGQRSPLDRWVSGCKELLTSSPNQDLSRVLEELEQTATPELLGSCIFGSAKTIDRYSSETFNIDVYSGTGKTPLCLAVENGHRHIVAHLFKCFKSRIKINKIMIRASAQLEELQSVRLRAYADAVSEFSEFENATVWDLANAQHTLQVDSLPNRIIPATALQAAIAAGNFDLVECLLLEHGANHSMCGGYFGDALQTTVISQITEPSDSTQYARILDLLLQKGAVVNSQGGFCGSSLLAAARFGHEKTLLRLLNEDTEVLMNGGEYHNVLHAAIMSERKTVVEYILRNYPKLINLPSRYGTPLQKAAGQNSLDIVGLLLKYEADVNAVSLLYESALVPAARLGHKQVVNLLISEGANVNHISKHCRQALLRQAAFYGIPALARILLSGSIDINAKGADLYRFTPLHLAAHAGHTDLIHLFLETGGREAIMDRNWHSFTPLDDAARHGRVRAIHQLVEEYATLKGPNSVGELVNAQSPHDKKTPAHHAAEAGKVDCILTLVDLGAKMMGDDGLATPLHVAVWNNRFAVVKAMLELNEQKKIASGFDVNARNQSGKTPLIDAAEQGFADIAALLLDHGADPLIRSKDNYNVFHWAGYRRHIAVVEVLFHEFARKEAKLGRPADLLNERGGNDHSGATALVDVFWQCPELIKTFLEHGARLNHKEIDGHSWKMLHRCVKEDRTENFCTFIEQAASIYEPNEFHQLLNYQLPSNNNTTLLQSAAACPNSSETTKLLLDKGADPSLKDGRGWTALHFAVCFETVQTVEILARAWPAALSIRTLDGQTPIETAKMNGHENVIQLLERLH